MGEKKFKRKNLKIIMKISVIIPVYNAEKFVEKAVESALQQEETGEVLLIEDKSLDNSLKVCVELEKRYEKVKLFRHPDGKNKGAGASRNLGIKNAKYDYIAFLDADDYYLPDRFKLAKKIFEKDKSIDGVYEAIGMHFYNSDAKKNWLANGGEILTTMTHNVNPFKLYEQLLNIGNGYIHLDGLVVKFKLLISSGLFLENLKLHQDTAFIFQISALGKLVPGELDKPVALRGIHSNNRITKNNNPEYTKLLLWETLLGWAQIKKISRKRISFLFRKVIETSCQNSHNQKTRFDYFLKIIKIMLMKFYDNPLLFLEAIVQSLRNRLLIPYSLNLNLVKKLKI